MAVEPRLMTADELLSLQYDGQRHELVEGELCTMPPAGSQHGDVTSVIDGALGPYVRAHRLGRVFTGEPGFMLKQDPDTVRAPDVAFVSRERLQAAGQVRGYWPGAPDLAVEVISPNDLYTEVDEKVAAWLEYGTRLVLVVNPRRQTVAVHQPGQPVRILGQDEIVDGADIVPGWSLRVGDLFDEA